MKRDTITLAQVADPTFYADGRLPARSDHRWYASEEEAQRGESSYEVSLDGIWKMHYAPSPAQAPEGFWREDADVRSWDDAPVPAHVQMLGYDRPQYVNTQYPWDGHETVEPGQTPTRFNPVSSYVRAFSLTTPLASGERLILRLEGAESNATVWLNGTYVGYSEDTFTPAEFDLTEHVRVGMNRLAIRVHKWCSGSWIESQDFYRFSGLFRSVTLLRVPAVHLADVRTSVRLAADFSSAEIEVRTRLEGAGSVSVHLGAGTEAITVTCDGAGIARCEITNPRLWSAEDPYLYPLTLTVRDASGAVTEVIPQQVGVRRFAIEGGVMRINGERIVFKGVNRHEFGPQGRVMSRERTREDLIALKRANINAIRTSHYPNNSFLYELCDELGFYVIDETNLETHGLWDLHADGRLPLEQVVPGSLPQWREVIIDRAHSMYERDKNHPCIVMWSCGNESFGGDNLADLAAAFRTWDTRPVHYEGVYWDPRRPDTTDVVSEMYTSVADLEKQLAQDRSKPYMLCEFAHAMGNSFGAVDKYMDLTERDPLFQGGFIWDFADQAILRHSPTGEPYWGYGGDCGEAPHNGDFCGNGIFYADHTPSPKLADVAHAYQPLRARLVGNEVEVTNRLLFTSSAGFDATVTVEREGVLVEQAPLATDVAPGATAHYPLPVQFPGAPGWAGEPGEYVITVSFALARATAWASAGHEVAWDQHVVTVAQSPASSRPAPLRPCGLPTPTGRVGTAASPGVGGRLWAATVPAAVGEVAGLEVVDGIHNLGVHGEGFDLLFSRLTGALTSFRFGRTRDGGRELLAAPVMPNFWHAPTANERGWNAPFEEGAWLLASRYVRPVREGYIPAVSTDGESVTVSFIYDLAGLPDSTCSLSYRVTPAGAIEVTQVLTPAEGVCAPPEMSTLLEVPGSLHRLRFYGHGPSESYVDRCTGTRLGVWESDVSEGLPGYLVPQESGNHTGVRWALLTDDHGCGLRFTSQPGAPMDFSALPWTPSEIENARHAWELPTTGRTVIRPALMRRGVGGDDSWGARTHPEYCLPTGPLTFRFTMEGVHEPRLLA